MLKCNEDSCSDDEQENQVSIERSLVVESAIEVDHLICSICHHIVWQPVACGSHNGCQNTFCTFCIDSWLKKCYSQQQGQPVCPHCKRIFISSRIPPILKSVLNSLNLLCPHSNNGCKEVIGYKDIESHLKTCDYKVKLCRGCKGEILARNYDSHTNICTKFMIECGYCGGSMPKVKYLQSHINFDGKIQRSVHCYQNQIGNLGVRVEEVVDSIDELNSKCDRLENITKALVVGQPLDLLISYYTTFTTHFTFPHPTLIKPSFNQSKQKFDFLHFYIWNPIYTDSFASVKWSLKINKMMGNILLGFCSNMNINSLDYIVNKYGELKRKDIQQSKYKIVRKNDFSFNQGDIIRCRYLSLLKVIKIENETKKQYLQLTSKQIQQFVQGGKIYVFISMDTLNDSLSFVN